MPEHNCATFLACTFAYQRNVESALLLCIGNKLYHVCMELHTSWNMTRSQTFLRRMLGSWNETQTSFFYVSLASPFSKLIEWRIILMYGEYLISSNLQFGFKKGLSTSMCAGLLKIVAGEPS